MPVALPIVAGPILLITCLEQGTAFGSRAAAGALLGLVPLALFALIFAWLSRRLGWSPTLLIAWASCVLIDFALSRSALGPSRAGRPGCRWVLQVVCPHGRADVAPVVGRRLGVRHRTRRCMPSTGGGITEQAAEPEGQGGRLSW